MMRAAALLLCVLPLSCSLLGPEAEGATFFVVMANDTDGAGEGPAVTVEMAMQFSQRNAELEFVPTKVETEVLQPGETQTLHYLNGQLNGQAQFEAREPGASTVLATTICRHRDREDEQTARRISLTGDGGGAAGYTLACLNW